MSLDKNLIASPIHNFFFNLRIGMGSWRLDQLKRGLTFGVDYAKLSFDAFCNQIQRHARILAVEVGVELEKTGLVSPSTNEWSEIMKIMDPTPLSGTIEYHLSWKQVGLTSGTIGGLFAVTGSIIPGPGTVVMGGIGAITGAAIAGLDHLNSRGKKLAQLKVSMGMLIDELLEAAEKKRTPFTNAILLQAKRLSPKSIEKDSKDLEPDTSDRG